MSFIESNCRLLTALAAGATVAVLAGCAARSPAPAPAPAAALPPAPLPSPAAPVTAPLPNPATSGSVRARHWDEYRMLAAQRIVSLNPAGTYMGKPPEPLLAIPVLEVELQADGSIARISVQRQPSQARDTVQVAIAAVQRAAPFGPVTHLPKPWKFSEVFLFDDSRRFKPRSLD